MERTVRTHCRWRGSVKTLAALLLRPGSVSFPSEMFGFLLACLPAAPPGYCPSQIGQCTRDPAVSTTAPPKAVASFTGRAAEEPAFTEPAGRQRAVLLWPLSGL